ncbi:DODA-type extradiol aromatic ring-opening family dioxygenase [Domibacillus epiphyticus]|uniref:Extradiol ring-cleavage dioxygenase n=1 Tax=Domibacillus epiphyticus TaxID=1714355 RepID=A0A1V2A8F5_9BACI|nr:MEMO1 family protein [Domibacillus epiphyticus]OMP67210.1 extradiol ring-cleavage dioxygenase [Domibacillus epiphyticus]
MTILFSMLAPHVPSICHEENAPSFQQEMVKDLKKTAEKIKDLKPDVIVLVSCHWPSTFFHYVDATPEHKGMLTAFECPDLIKDVPYFFPGDAELAAQLVEAGEKNGIKAVSVNDPYYVWDYGSVVPLRYLVPDEDIPVINLSVTLAASLQETYEWGKTIKKVLEDSPKKIVFVSSGALSHNLVRGRENKPTSSEHAMDKEFLQLIEKKDYESAYHMLPQYARLAGVESGGRHLAMLLSVIDQENQPTIGAAGQSSGSWNAVITFQ